MRRYDFLEGNDFDKAEGQEGCHLSVFSLAVIEQALVLGVSVECFERNIAHVKVYCTTI